MITTLLKLRKGRSQRSILAVLGLALMVVLGAVFATDSAAEEWNRRWRDVAAVEEVFDLYAEAVNTSDFELWISLWDEDGIRMPPDEPAQYGKEEIQAAVEPIFAALDLEMEIITEEVQIAGKMAFARGTYTLDGYIGGTLVVSIDGKFLTVLKKQNLDDDDGDDDGDDDDDNGGYWMIARDCFNSNVPPPPCP